METKDHTVYADLRELMSFKHRAKGFSFLPRQPMHSVLAGRHASRLRGRGLNFEELRHYRSGDDIRAMDWKVTNRTGKPHVRVYTEERERPVILVVDQRVNMFFGSVRYMKSVIAAQLTSLAAWRVLASGDRVGAVIFDDSEVIEIRPHRSQKTVMRILKQTVAMNHRLNAGMSSERNDAQLSEVVHKTEQLCSHDHLVVIISDLSGWNEQTLKLVKRISRHNDIVSAHIYDPLERQLPESGRLLVSDGVMQIEVNANDANLQAGFAEAFTDHEDYIESELRKHNIPLIPINTIEPVDIQLRLAMGRSAGG
ncbi:MAG: DUF58 domain-containing protein [Gammaproteobacteria bacterium]|nr:DUF58 domain-containing protein [Gammaproteobacteria bacterium]